MNGVSSTLLGIGFSLVFFCLLLCFGLLAFRSIWLNWNKIHPLWKIAAAIVIYFLVALGSFEQGRWQQKSDLKFHVQHTGHCVVCGR